MDCAIICVIIKINMATNDVLIAFFVLILFLLYNFRFERVQQGANAPYAFLFSFAVSFQTFAVLLLQCFLCIFIEMITDNIDCLPDFLCKCVPLCFCIHHFFLSLNPRQRVIPLFSVRTLFFKSGPKWALPVS